MISYAITAYNEIEELTKLVNSLRATIQSGDEIVIQLDTKATKEVREYTNILKDVDDIVIIEFPLNNHFANFKNNLKKHCKNDWIFQIDADELLVPTLALTIRDILEINQDTDVILVPRINTVVGMTPDDIRTYGWRVDEQGWVNFPDYQFRLYRNKEEINWVGDVHERLAGFKNMSRLPSDKDYCLLHEKTIERQRKQNEFYISTFNK